MNKETWRNRFYVLKVCQERDALGDVVCLISSYMIVWFLSGSFRGKYSKARATCKSNKELIISQWTYASVVVANVWHCFES